MLMPDEILVAREADIATVTLSNPGKLNAVTARMWRELKRVMEALSGDDTVRCVVIRGAGDKAFAAGGDIEEFVTLRDSFDRARIYHEEWAGGAMQAIVACRHPTVALIQGACIGGGLEVAGQCDLRIAGESARFGAPINRLGFTMAHEELRGLLALAGPAVTLEILLEGRIFGAAEAYDKGLVTRVVPDGAVAEEAYAAGRRIAAGAPLVARWHKRLVRRLAFDPRPLSAEEARENYAYLDTDDYREGMAAFRERRTPRFRGR